MQKSNTFLWLAFALLLLLPTPLGRFFLDLAGGLMILSLFIPVVLGAVGWVGWKLLKANMLTCQVCGLSSLPNTSQCPACGSTSFRNTAGETSKNTDSRAGPASSATIDITAEDVDKDL